MIVIGIVGGVASGKSLVAAQLARFGAIVLDADQVGHEVLLEEEVKRAVEQRWGQAVFDKNGEVSRASLAKIVFAPPPSGPAELEQLERIVHPRIGNRLRERIDELSCDENVTVVVLDAPVMFKAGWDKYCNRILFVEVDRESRYERALGRGWDEETWKARENSQESLEDKRNRADVIIENSGSEEATFSQVSQFWQALQVELAQT
jgi:dephospho-CoA kinase